MRSVLVLPWKEACSPRWRANARGVAVRIATGTDRSPSLRAVLAGPEREVSFTARLSGRLAAHNYPSPNAAPSRALFISRALLASALLPASLTANPPRGMKRRLPASVTSSTAPTRSHQIDLTRFAFQPAASQPSSSSGSNGSAPVVIDITDDTSPEPVRPPSAVAAARPPPRRLPASFGHSTSSSAKTRGDEREPVRPVTLTLSLTSLTSFTATLSRPHAKAAQKVEALHDTAGRPLECRGGSGEAPGSALSWLFGLAQYEPVLRELSAAAKSWHGLSLEQVPRAALAAATLGGSAPSADSEATRRLLETVPRALLEQLAPYQRDGVAFVLRRAGRAGTTIPILPY